MVVQVSPQHRVRFATEAEAQAAGVLVRGKLSLRLRRRGAALYTDSSPRHLSILCQCSRVMAPRVGEPLRSHHPQPLQ